MPAIWIANDIGGFDPAHLRRFLYAIEFKVPPRSVRRRIVGRHLGRLDLGPACLERLADLETVSPAQFGQAAQLLQLAGLDTLDENEALLSRVLQAGMAAVGQSSRADGREAAHSWEVTRVNELLQQMEAFDGIFVCATNRFENLDPATLRRFSFKLPFDYLNPQQRRRLFLQEAGCSEREFTAELRRRLDRLVTLTPGDFANVQRQCRTLGETFSPEEFLNQLEEEIHLKNVHGRAQPIGFVR